MFPVALRCQQATLKPCVWLVSFWHYASCAYFIQTAPAHVQPGNPVAEFPIDAKLPAEATSPAAGMALAWWC